MLGFSDTHPKYQPFKVAQKVRFTSSGKYDYDFKKGDTAIVERVISPYPRATDTIYIVKHEGSNVLMWVTGSDIIDDNQLSVEDYCPAFSRPAKGGKTFFCTFKRGHAGWHKSYKGVQWYDSPNFN